MIFDVQATIRQEIEEIEQVIRVSEL